MRLLKVYSLTRLLMFQCTAQLLFGLLLLGLHQQSLSTLVVLIVLFMSLVNAIGTNSLSLLLQQRGQLAGSASALAVSLQFGMGALASLAVSWLQDDTPLAMTLVMAVCSVLAWLGQRISLAHGTPSGAA